MKLKMNTGVAPRNALLFVLEYPLLFLMILLTLASCRNDDNDNLPDAQQLVGIWQPYRFTQTATLSTGAYSQTTEYTECQQRSRIYFSETDGNVKTYAEENGSCMLQGNNAFTYTYNAANRSLTVNNADGTSQTGTVLELTTSSLIYELIGTYDFQGESNVLVKTVIYARRTKD